MGHQQKGLDVKHSSFTHQDLLEKTVQTFQVKIKKPEDNNEPCKDVQTTTLLKMKSFCVSKTSSWTMIIM